MGRRSRLKIKYLKQKKVAVDEIRLRELNREAHKRAAYPDPFFLNAFGYTAPIDLTEASQNARRAQLGFDTSDTRSSREDVIERARLLALEYPAQRRVVLINKKYNKICMTWTEDHNQYKFIRVVYSIVLTSIGYPTRDLAMAAFHRNKITWIERRTNPQTAPQPQAPSV